MPRNCKYVAKVRADLSEFAALYKAATEDTNGSDRWVDVQPGYMAFHFEAHNAHSKFCIYVASRDLELITSEEKHMTDFVETITEPERATIDPKTYFSHDIRKLFKDWKQDKLLEELETHHTELLKRRVDTIQYGDPDKLIPFPDQNDLAM